MKPLIGALVLSLMSPVVLAAKLYRFEVDGRMVMKDNVPPEFALLGYEVLNSRGYVIETVDPAPTAEELAIIAAAKAVEDARLERIKLLQEKDRSLLKIYSMPSDVERARKRKISALDGDIDSLKRRTLDLEKKLEHFQERVVIREQAGDHVSEKTHMHIAKLQSIVLGGHEKINKKELEKKDALADFENDQRRMTILQKYPPGTLEADIPESNVPESNVSESNAPESNAPESKG